MQPCVPAVLLSMPMTPQVCLHSADGQDTDVNYFRNVFSSIFPPPQSTAMKAIDAAFTVSIKTLPGPPKDWCVPQPSLSCKRKPASVSKPTRHGWTNLASCRPPAARNLPLYDAAKISPDGTPVTNVVDPYQVFFTPTAEVGAAKPLILNSATTCSAQILLSAIE